MHDTTRKRLKTDLLALINDIRLPITKSLADAHGADLEITSQPGVGTRCAVIFRRLERSLPLEIQNWSSASARIVAGWVAGHTSDGACTRRCSA